jgi:hypothetical protein
MVAIAAGYRARICMQGERRVYESKPSWKDTVIGLVNTSGAVIGPVESAA